MFLPTGKVQSVNLFLSSKGIDCPKFSSSILADYEFSRTSKDGRECARWKRSPLTMFLPSYIVASLMPQQVQACIFLESLRSLPGVLTGHAHHRSGLHAPEAGDSLVHGSHGHSRKNMEKIWKNNITSASLAIGTSSIGFIDKFASSPRTPGLRFIWLWHHDPFAELISFTALATSCETCETHGSQKSQTCYP